MLWKPSEDASKRSSKNQIYQGHQTRSAQFRQLFMWVTGKTMCVTWRPHQAITFSIKTEKGNTVSEKKYNFRRSNFDIIPLNNLILEIMPSYDLKFSRAESMMKAEDTSRKDEPPLTIHRGSTMMSNRLLEGGREPMNQKEGATMMKLSQNT